MPVKDFFLALLVVAIWGFNFVAIKVGVNDIPPLMLNAMRFSLVVIPWVFFIKKPNIGWSYIIGFGMFLGVIQFGLLFTAMKWGMSASLSSIVLQLQAFFTILFAFLLLGEKPKSWQIMGAFVAFSGIGIIAAERYTGGALVPFLMCVAAASSWGVANIITKKAGQVNMLNFVVWGSLIPPIPLLILSLMLEDHAAIWAVFTNPQPLSISAAFYLAYPTTILGFGIWNHLLKKHPASLVAPFSLMVPVFGVLSGTIFLGESMSSAAIIGGTIILLGLMLNVFGGRFLAKVNSSRPNQTPSN